MKKSITVLFFLIFSIQAFAQTINFTDSNMCFLGPDVATLSGNDGGIPQRNIYSGAANNGSFPFRIIWDNTDNRWELQADTDGNGSFETEAHGNSFASAPNPPQLGAGTWNDLTGGTCGALNQFNGSGTQTALPVELTSFRTEVNKNVVNLTWQTASEENNAGFQIERSSNGHNWQALDFVTGRGTTEELQNYNYPDQRPIPGYNYYRLKQIDFDGQFEYSDVRSVLVGKEDNQLIEVYPNPSQGQFTLSLHNPNQKNARIKLFDSTGNMIWQQDFREQEALAYWEKQFDLPQREVYFVMTQVGDEIETMKVSVMSDQ